MKTFTIYDKQGNQIRISEKDYVSEGGEGKIFIKNNIVYKIYHNAADVIAEKKLAELSVLQKSNIINPKHHFYDDKRMPIGYTMPYICNTVPLPKLFTTSFRNRAQITPDSSVKLVENFIDTIQYIHEKDILIVDGNEFNYLIDGTDYIIPYFIDVDSYQTKNYPAKVIMPSIRDWQSKKFDKNSDWFSFGVIATQIFIGIHPFKGSHPDFDSVDAKDRMRERVLKNKSIFNKKSSVPPATRPFNLIPQEYRIWLEEMFEQGKRLPPPQVVTKLIVKPQVTIMQGSNKFNISKLYETDESVLGINYIHGHRIVYTKGYIHLESRKIPSPSASAGVIYYNNNPYMVDIIGGMLSIQPMLAGTSVMPITIQASSKLIIDNRIYIINDDRLSEIKFSELGSKIFIAVGNTWNIMPNSTKIYREVLVENILGKAYLLIPSQENTCQIVSIPELDKCHIVDGKYEDHIAAFLVSEHGVYNRYLFVFNDSFTSYEARVERDVDVYSINFVSLPNGIYALLDENGYLEIGSRKSSTKNVITGTNLNPDLTLCHDGTTVCYALDKEVYSLKMK